MLEAVRKVLVKDGYARYLEYPIHVIDYPHVSSGEDYLTGTEEFSVFFTLGSLLVEVI